MAGRGLTIKRACMIFADGTSTAGRRVRGQSFSARQVAAADSGAQAAAAHSPGVLSGNVVQVPVHIPVNVCGNTIDVIGLLNPAFGNECEND